LNIIEAKGLRSADWDPQHEPEDTAAITASYQSSLLRLVVYASVCAAAFSATSLFLSSGLYQFVLPAAIVVGVSFVLTLVRLRIHLREHRRLGDQARVASLAVGHSA
jgi:hypothetical protein